jgi:hypothetical protein
MRIKKLPRKVSGPSDRSGPGWEFEGELLRLLLFLLTDADFVLCRPRVFESLVVVTARCIVEERVDIRVFRKHSHQGVAFITSGAERSEPFDIGDRHNKTSLANCFGSWCIVDACALYL